MFEDVTGRKWEFITNGDRVLLRQLQSHTDLSYVFALDHVNASAAMDALSRAHMRADPFMKELLEMQGGS